MLWIIIILALPFIMVGSIVKSIEQTGKAIKDMGETAKEVKDAFTK